jgi:threonine/homoserine/homoserine lactone efflux protein
VVVQPDELMRSLAAGSLCGFVVSVPVGPVNLTVINQALRKGFWIAFLAGLGGIFAECIYASLMLAGHSSILDKPSVVLVMRVVAVVAIALLGIRNLMTKPEKIELSAVTAQRVDERWHHPRSFLLGFILTISNLMLLLLWATLAAVLFARDWVQPDLANRTMCVVGVFCGGTLWFFLLAFFVSRAHRRVKPKTLTILVRACGVVFLLFAGMLAYELFVPSSSRHHIDLLHRAP